MSGCRWETRQSKHCGFCIYIFDKSFDQSKSIVRLVRTEKMVLSGLVFARKIARMILIQNIQGLMGPLMINMAFMPLYMWEMWNVTSVTHGRTDKQWKVEQYSVWAESAIQELTAHDVTHFTVPSILSVTNETTSWRWHSCCRQQHLERHKHQQQYHS